MRSCRYAFYWAERAASCHRRRTAASTVVLLRSAASQCPERSWPARVGSNQRNDREPERDVRQSVSVGNRRDAARRPAAFAPDETSSAAIESSPAGQRTELAADGAGTGRRRRAEPRARHRGAFVGPHKTDNRVVPRDRAARVVRSAAAVNE